MGLLLYTGGAFGADFPFQVTPETDGSTWTDFNNQRFLDGPYEMAFDSKNGAYVFIKLVFRHLGGCALASIVRWHENFGQSESMDITKRTYGLFCEHLSLGQRRGAQNALTCSPETPPVLS